MESDSAEIRDLKAIAEHIHRAKQLLNRHDPIQGDAWRELDRAEARLHSLSTVVPYGD